MVISDDFSKTLVLQQPGNGNTTSLFPGLQRLLSPSLLHSEHGPLAHAPCTQEALKKLRHAEDLCSFAAAAG